MTIYFKTVACFGRRLKELLKSVEFKIVTIICIPWIPEDFCKGHYKDFIEATVETVHKKQIGKNDNEMAKMKQTNKQTRYYTTCKVFFSKKKFARIVNCLIIPGFAVVTCTCTLFSLSSFLLTFPGSTKVFSNNNIVLGSLNLHKLLFFFVPGCK